MSIGNEWLTAFPIRPATEAVEALCESWDSLAGKPLQGFHPGKREPDLTRALKAHIESVTARKRGLLGMWVAESVLNEIDPTTAVLLQERRNDIVYGWNDSTSGIQLVFEFKKMTRQARDRSHYLGSNGLGRFVSGIYSRHQAVAAMVGILIDPLDEVVPPLRAAFSKESIAGELRLRNRSNGAAIERPSVLFAKADFDTEHERDPEIAPSHGTIHIAHIFLQFGYPVPKRRRKKSQLVVGITKLH